MDLVIKHFSELTADELYEIYRARVAVFVVEQRCAYQEVDDDDRRSYHFWFSDNGELVSYLRLIVGEQLNGVVRIGRVLSLRRREGLAKELVSEAVAFAKDRLSAKEIDLDAQTYVRALYESQGFEALGEEFLEDGIPHIAMRLSLKNSY